MRMRVDVVGRRARPRADIAIVLALSLTPGCSDFFTAEVAGFLVRERGGQDGMPAESGMGVNGAGVRIFLERPASFDAPDFVAHTTTISNRSAGLELPGFYRTSVAWETSSPAYGDSGDIRSIWIATRHADYEDRVVEFDAVQSSTINSVPEILLRGLRVGPDRVTGEVHLDGAGVDGVRVALSLEGGGQTFEARSRTVDGRPGVYAFDDVRWDREAGTEAEATVEVDDPSYRSAGPLDVTLSTDQTITVHEAIAVRPAFFAFERLSGRVIDASGQGVGGVRVVLRPERSRDSSARTATVTTAMDGQSGIYRFSQFGWLLPEDGALFDAYDTQTVLLEIEDGAYERASGAGELTVRVGYLEALDVAEDLVVARRPRARFAALLQGRCVEPSAHDAAPPRGVAGVEVTAVLVDDDGPRMLVTRTDPEGRYTLLADWKREQTDSDAPSGEDALVVELRFSSVPRGELRLVFEPLAYLVRSWIRPNYVADAVASIDDEADAGM